MSYQTPITIFDAVNKIRKREYVLPSIQREFVWGTAQIERLFDSLMRDYPISTFLFWKVEKSRIGDFQFYEFLRNYHERDSKHNTKLDLTNDEDKVAILDGQQRLTSLYIALVGSLAKKAPYYRMDSPKAFPKKKLYLDLLAPSEDLESEYNFKFLTEEAAAKREKHFWFECGQMLEIDQPKKLNQYLVQNKLMDTSLFTSSQSEFASDTLYEFFDVIHKKGSISFYEETSNELDKVLQIFIRINSGGTKLSYSDLLLSIATAEWKDKDAREVIHGFVDEINKIGDGFSFDKDNVLKTCLVLADLDVKFKVDNFTKKNMALIEKNWDGISLALKSAILLISKLGYRSDNLRATNAVIPIAYFIYKNEFEQTILHKKNREEDRKAISEWLARVLLKGTFGGQPDSIYPQMRKLINENIGEFPLKKIIAHYARQVKSISFSEDDIENLLDLEYGKGVTYSALSLLYPGLNYNFTFHQDHIHPKASFDKRKLRSAGFDEEDIQTFHDYFNTLPNLQLLEGTQNMEKGAKPFKTWLKEKYKKKSDRGVYLQQHYISNDVSLKLEDFEEFCDERWETLKQEFTKILGATTKSSKGKT